MTFTNQPDVDLNGMLTWIKSMASGFPGFEMSDEFQAVGSRYEFPSDGSLVLDWPFPHSGMVLGTAKFASGNLFHPFTNSIGLGADNRFINASDNGLVLKLDRSNGRFSGRVVAPGTTRPIPIQGVLLQKIAGGYGYFLESYHSGSIVLQGNE
jgi:hypothetical protein